VALRQRDPEAIMAVFPADHLIVDAAGFRQAIAAAARIARDGYLVTLGVAPDRPHTGYGYIERGASLGRVDGLEAFEVQRFTEKPDADTAREFVDSGEFYWNGGIFVWQAATILAEMERLLPDLHAQIEAIARAWDKPDGAEVLTAAWQQVPQTTIDYGIMEKAARVAVVSVDIGWDDVGNWATLSRRLPADENGNAVRGQGDCLLIESAGTYVHASAGRLVAAVGLEGFVVVDTPDAVLICPKDRAQSVRDVVDRLEAGGLEKYL
jgi:mannose-1-phosphate guanylyltransferase